MKHKFPFLLSVLLISITSFQAQGRPVIYGDDNRIEPFESEGSLKIKRATRSVALILEEDSIKPTASKRYSSIKTEHFGKSLDLCSSERFYDQGRAGFCTGFLVGEDLLATASHCLPKENSCEDFAVLFDFKQKQAITKQGLRVSNDRLFRCAEVLYFPGIEEEERFHKDLALIRLDRSTARPALSLATKKVEEGGLFSLIGHPYGIPLKIAHSGFLLENEQESFFSLAIDSYSGNSGSPVLNEETGLVEGVLVRGQSDFVRKGNCNISMRCTSVSCMGEDALRAPLIRELLGAFL